jgi:hypothetical protein
MGILDELFGRNYSIERVPSPKELMDNALSHSVHGDSALQYISAPQESQDNQ